MTKIAIDMKSKKNISDDKGSDSFLIGIDAGSRFTKGILFKNGRLYRRRMIDTGQFYRDRSRLLGDWPKARICATGYGRNKLTGVYGGQSIKNIPEIHAHCFGAVCSTGLKDFVLLDLGGQDTKVALVRDGKLRDFITNDKCAASCGRTVENIARVLDISLKKMLAVKAKPQHLTSTCAVFAESEAIGLLAAGIDPESIAAGILDSLARRLIPDIGSMPQGKLVFVGGLAGSDTMVSYIADKTGRTVIVPPYHKYNAAIGCAYTLATENQKI